jgi:hypothetical protein
MIALTATTSEVVPNYFPASCEKGGIEYAVNYNFDPNRGVVKAYHILWQEHPGEDVLIYMHDDVTIHDPDWVKRIALEMMDPQVAICGLGGATSIGSPNIYKKPYDLIQLARGGYVSNQRDWEVHGDREVSSRKVSVVDGFLMAVRGSFLGEISGWDWIESNFHCYDTAMCLMAIRRGYEVRMAGVDCEHHGGRTSTSPGYREWCKENGTTVEEEHSKPHRWLYEEFRDVLPVQI